MELLNNHEFHNELRYAALHEFGHAAGLYHENWTPSYARRVTPLDNSSIMSFFRIGKAKLSEGDIQALRCLLHRELS
ncbi:MAG: hypothetical protein L6Q37_04675 [Bdellovibrionaceae bacterium]|nr:hypothetical protein [Pseudobdellovibrionaceae bacterium]NUM59029.1 hypothetical protein [Pseudobdellovibrionaceae bacterium]